jgi:hemolysin activation/secretion protein
MKNSKIDIWCKRLLVVALGVYSSAGMTQEDKASSVENLNRNMTGPGIIKPPVRNAVKAQSMVDASVPALKAGGAALQVRGFQFDGATVFSAEELMLASGARLRESYDLLGLQAIADAVTIHYRQSGYLVARAWLLSQNVGEGGMVRIRILEGYLSKTEPIQINAKSADIDKQRVEKIALQSLCDGGDCSSKPLTQERVDRAALLVAEITGYQVKGELVPGKELGTTSMVLNITPRLGGLPQNEDSAVGALVAPKNGYAVEVSVDNFGSQVTGVNRAQARLVVGDLLQAGDHVGVSYMTTNKADMKNFTLDYSIAVGYDGWRVGASAGKAQYTLSTYGYAGDAATANVYASYPIVRSSEKNIDFRVDLDRIKLSDESSTPQNRRLNAVRAGLAGDFQDQAVMDQGASTSWGVAVVQSDVKYDEGITPSSGGVGRNDKYTTRLTRLQNLGNTGWYADVNMNGQQAAGNLDSYGKLFLGGANAVRAYAGGEVGGDTAYVGQFAVGKSWATTYNGQGIQTSVSTFYDRGWARLQEDPVAGTTDNQATRAGWGFEVKVVQKDQFSLRTFWAKGQSGVSVVDQKKSRVGLSLGLAF